jgi:hypothetical protein
MTRFTSGRGSSSGTASPAYEKRARPKKPNSLVMVTRTAPLGGFQTLGSSELVAGVRPIKSFSHDWSFSETGHCIGECL